MITADTYKSDFSDLLRRLLVYYYSYIQIIINTKLVVVTLCCILGLFVYDV